MIREDLTRSIDFAERTDKVLESYLTESGVEWHRLSDPDRLEAETAWRGVYGRVFVHRPRLKHRARAEHEYRQQSCGHYLVVPFSSGVHGLSVDVHEIPIAAYACRGPLVPLGQFHNAEFFVCPPDLSWTMIHTHEDHSLGGPFFIRIEWLTGG